MDSSQLLFVRRRDEVAAFQPARCAHSMLRVLSTVGEMIDYIEVYI